MSPRDDRPLFIVCPRGRGLDLDTIEERARLRAEALPDAKARAFVAELQRDRSSELGPALAASPDGPWLIEVPDGALHILARSSAGDLTWTARDLGGCLALAPRELSPILAELKSLAQVALVHDALLILVTRTRPPPPILSAEAGFPDSRPRDPVQRPGPRFLLAPPAGLGAIRTRQLNAEDVRHAPFLTRYRLPEMLAELLEGQKRIDLEAFALHSAGPWIIPIPTAATSIIAGADEERLARWTDNCTHAWTYEPQRPARNTLRRCLTELKALAARALRRDRHLIFATYEVPEMLPQRSAAGPELAIEAREDEPPSVLAARPAEDLIGELGREDWRGKIALISQLAGLKDQASGSVAALARILKDPNPQVRRWAAYALGEIGEAAREANAALSLAAWDEHPEVARGVAVAQQKIRDATEAARRPSYIG